MSIENHLDELRSRLIRIFFILFLGFFICYGLGDNISEILLSPLREALKGQEGGRIIYLGVLDKVLAQFQVAFWSSILLSSPLWFREVWLFIRPGLHSHEIKVIRPFLFVGLFLFIFGVLFGYKIVFPVTFGTLLSFGVQDVEAMMNLRDYLVLSSKVLVFLGIVFQMPNVLLILGFMGLVTKYSLRNMRRYVYLGLAFFSAFLTPPDILTMLGLWLPLVLLFEVGILGVAWIVHPYLARKYS